MSSSMNINGVSISSSKNGMSITNGRAQFADGSWVDTASGRAENCGPGTLIVNGRSIEPGTSKNTNGPSLSKPKVIDEAFTGISHLTLDVSAFDVDISIATGPVTVKTSGDGPILDTLTLSPSESTLSVSDSRSGGGNTTISIGRTNVSFGGISINAGSVNFGGGTANVKLDITVPEGTTIDAKTRGANAFSVGNTKANMAFKQTGSGNAVIGDVAGAELVLSGSGNINAKKVSGNMSVTLSGSGSITVEKNDSDISEIKLSGMGTINVASFESLTNSLHVKLSGSGNLLYRGTAETADIKLSGMGDINVSKVVHKPTVKKTGMGRLTVGNWMG